MGKVPLILLALVCHRLEDVAWIDRALQYNKDLHLLFHYDYRLFHFYKFHLEMSDMEICKLCLFPRDIPPLLPLGLLPLRLVLVQVQD
jgi:hypothetical protein